MKKIFDKLVLILLILQPIIDVITYFQINNNSSFLSVSVIIRSIIMIIAFLYLFKVKLASSGLCLNTNAIYLLINFEDKLSIINRHLQGN